MSEPVISLANVSKLYKRFNSPLSRAWDALKLPVSKKHYNVFSALNDINFECFRGEKIAIVGCNGAGKSTLLRLISGLLQPTTGSIKVNGKIKVLMDLGTEFHPEFSGLQNINSSLAYHGISGKELALKTEEIIDFTELESFIERPVREYSAGMYARLAFAVATSIVPEILIIDEILGAGDAYFMGKSIQRMKNLTSGGATVLFVSHDMSSVQLLCERAIWLHQGRMRADGNTLSVSKEYLAYIREQEECRLQSRDKFITREQAKNLKKSEHSLLLRFIGEDGQPPKDPFYLHKLVFGHADKVYGTLSATSTHTEESHLLIDKKYMNWGMVEKILEKECRSFGDFGGQYGHAPFILKWDNSYVSRPTKIEIEYFTQAKESIYLELFDEENKKYIPIASFNDKNDEKIWKKSVFELPFLQDANEAQLSSIMFEQNEAEHPNLQSNERYGTQEILITGFGFYDINNVPRYTLVSGEYSQAIISYNAKENIYDPVAVIAIYRPDGTCALQVISKKDNINFGKISDKGIIKAVFNPLFLGPGEYMISVALFKEIDLAQKHEPQAYDLHDRCYPLKVLAPGGIGVEIGIVNQPVEWLKIS